MITAIFFAFVLLSVMVALTDWRRGWFLAFLCGVLQDPARKLTPGTPVAMSMTIVIIYAVIVLTARRTLIRNARELTVRFPNLYQMGLLLLVFLALAALNGLQTYGIGYWKVPTLSLFIYLIPLPAAILGYVFLQREEDLIRFFRFYAPVTAIALIGTPLEFFRVKFPALGAVASSEDFIRHLPGIQIRVLSGFYRGGDIMGWHAATLAMISIIMAMRSPKLTRAWIWIAMSAWGFLNCLISGRRKVLYMVAVFAIVFVWRYYRRLTVAHTVLFATIGLAVILVMRNISADEATSVYARGSGTTRSEVLSRLEGGLVETVRQFGIMGAGLGTATQGVRHLLGPRGTVGWQEGGLGKLTIELGIPGVLVAALLALTLARLLIRITRFPDEPGSTQLIRVGLFGIVLANGINFMVSAQAYSDPVLVLLTAFFLGCLLGTVSLQERMLAEPVAPPAHTTLPARA